MAKMIRVTGYLPVEDFELDDDGELLGSSYDEIMGIGDNVDMAINNLEDVEIRVIEVS